MSANLADCLVGKGGAVYYPGPGNEAVRSHFASVMPQGVAAVAVDVWEIYHCNLGEIHCGTAAVRPLPLAPPWWKQDVIKTGWENEK